MDKEEIVVSQENQEKWDDKKVEMGTRFRKLCKGLKDHFRMNNTNTFIMVELIPAGVITVDIMKFDDWLHRQYPNYEDEGKSMSDIILEKYGKEAHDFFNDAMEFKG